MVVALPKPSSIATPALLTTVSPVVTLPSSPRSMFSASCTSNPSPSTLVLTPMLLPVVKLAGSVSPPVMLRIEPSGRLTLVPLSPAKLRPAAVAPLTAAFTSPAVAALLALAPSVMSPALATLVMTVLPASIPPAVMLGPTGASLSSKKVTPAWLYTVLVVPSVTVKPLAP